MAKHGFKLLDSDMHIIEPPDLWERYIDPARPTSSSRRATEGRCPFYLT
jgi:hypothetical protein